MRVLMTAGLYTLGGSSTVIENLADKLSKKAVNVTVGALMFKRFPRKGAYNVSAIPMGNVLKLRRFLENFDIIHNHHPIVNYLALISRKPFIYHYHGAPNFGKGKLFRFSMLFSIKMTKHRFDAVIAVSESAAEEFRLYFNRDDVHVVYNGVNTNHFKNGLDERFRKGIPQFLFVGNLYKHKRVEELIRALKELVKAYPKAHLQIVGGGYSYARLESFVVKLNLQDHVALIGRVPDSDLPYYYASCDVYITASRYEACPVPLLEAMACGKPVTASSIPSHAEMLSKSRAGALYRIGEKEDLCAKMTTVYEEKNQYRSNALRFAKKNDWSAVADRVLNVYDTVLRKANGRAHTWPKTTVKRLNKS